MTDLYAAWRHLDGQLVTVRTTKVVDDPDGMRAGVVLDETPPTPLFLPALPDDGDDDE